MHTNRSRTPLRQAGMSTGGVLLLIVALILGGMLALKMVPAYIQFFAVDDVVSGLTDDVPLREGRSQSREIRELILKRLRVNGVYDFDPAHINVEKVHDRTIVTVAYEVREHFVGNVDVVMSFKSQADL